MLKLLHFEIFVGAGQVERHFHFAIAVM